MIRHYLLDWRAWLGVLLVGFSLGIAIKYNQAWWPLWFMPLGWAGVVLLGWSHLLGRGRESALMLLAVANNPGRTHGALSRIARMSHDRGLRALGRLHRTRRVEYRLVEVAPGESYLGWFVTESAEQLIAKLSKVDDRA